MSIVASVVHSLDVPLAVGGSVTEVASSFTPSRALGRMHPMLVHFPIALAIAGASVEAWRAVRREPGMSPITPALLLAAAATGIVAALTGWINAWWEYANESSESLFWHRWIGTGAAVLLVAVAWWAWRSRRSETLGSAHVACRLGAIVAAVAVAVAGHMGGELVHGEGYVLKGLSSRSRSAASALTGAPPPAPPPVADGQARLFVERVQPIFAERCVECHGPNKQKGGLRLEPIEAALADTDMPAILPGDPDGSELLIRLLLPAEDADAMPPEGERLSDGDIDAIRRWIAEGAVTARRVTGPSPESRGKHESKDVQ